MAKCRCTECQRQFTPDVRASDHQRVCGKACRKLRRNRLARHRRQADLEAHRADERERQRKHRDGPAEAKCHEPASDAKALELLKKWEEIVDRATRLSRATFRRDAMRILREMQAAQPGNVDGAGACHELASALGAAETGSAMAAGVDGVTDRYRSV